MQNARYGVRQSESSGIGKLFEGPVAWILTLVLLPILLVSALLLPPVNLLDRLQSFTYTRITTAGGAIRDGDGTTVNFPAESVRTAFMANIESIPRTDFIEGQAGRDLYEAARTMPDHLVPKSPFYQVDLRGTGADRAILTIPIPNDSLPYETLGLYAWNGQRWQHLPSTVLPVEDIVESRLEFVPTGFMVMQTTPAVPAVTADLGLQGTLPQDAMVSSEAKAGLYLRGDGALEGTAPVNTGATTPIIRNWTDEVVRTDLVNNLLIDPGLQENQLVAVEQTVVQNGYPGVIIDYRGVDAVPSARADFVHLMTRLAERLHRNNKTLAIRVEAPRQVSAEAWDTLGYDWPGLAAVADKLIIPAPIDPRAYQPNGEMDALMTWAGSQVERRKLQVEISAQSVERSGNYLLHKGYQEALRPLLGQIATDSNANQEISLTLDNPRLMSQVTWNDSLGMYHYDFIDDQGFQRTVYLETAGSIAHKLQMLQEYNIRNVSLHTPSSGDIDPNIWNVVLQFQQGIDLSGVPTQLSVSYTIFDQNGGLVAEALRPIHDPRVVLNASAATGDLRIDAQVVNASGQPLGAGQSTTVALGRSVPAPAAAADPEVSAASAADTPEFRQAQAPAAEPLDPNRIVLSSGQVVNVREGPGTVYQVLGQIAPNTRYDITAKNGAGDWWQIEFNGRNGWIIGQLVNTAGDLGRVAATTDYPEPPPPPEPAPQAEPAPAAAAPAVSAPAPTGGGSFGYGVQAHMVHNDQAVQVMDMTRGLGFGWVKQQIEWHVFEGTQGNIDWGSMEGIINAANTAGISLLFSTVNAPNWAREPGYDGSVGGPPQDPATFAAFNGAVAARYCGSSLKAIEVWNEQNLHYEWGNKPLNAAEYVALLAPSFAAIKAACPSMYVISGALTPAGNNMPYAMDDMIYLEQMFQAGLNRYMDGLGAHPSGYNVPPSVTWQDACAAIQVHGNSFNGACDSPHHSWSFRSTMEGYRNVMVAHGAGNKKVWPTEFGWASGMLDPRYGYAADNTREEQAKWTVEAYQMMKNWGWVGPAILWNLNFRVVADGTEKAQWGIVSNNWQPLPIYNALRDMPK